MVSASHCSQSVHVCSSMGHSSGRFRLCRCLLVQIGCLLQLITFDGYGVSGHPNHIAAYHGVQWVSGVCSTIFTILHTTFRHLLSSFGSSSKSPQQLQGYRLHSVPLYRKYIGPLDIHPVFIHSLLFDGGGHRDTTSSAVARRRRTVSRSRSRSPTRRRPRHALPVHGRTIVFVAGWEGVWTAYRAMHAHVTQLVWFRRLYIVFSRYMYLNVLEPI